VDEKSFKFLYQQFLSDESSKKPLPPTTSNESFDEGPPAEDTRQSKRTHPWSAVISKEANSRCSCVGCKPCTQPREPCSFCQFGRAENRLLLKKLEGYEKEHAPMRQRNDTFSFTLMVFAFFYWLSATLFAEQMFCLVVSWALLGLVSVVKRSMFID
tara:strand:- start:4836 stop:5306 length:471 start_codon:yes stop_codon:yes gene_type:complete